MPDEPEPNLKLEIAHVLLIDVVGYSKLLVNEQVDVLQKLNAVVRNTEHFRAAEASGQLMRLPTGDGMALLFFNSPEAPVQCALEIARAARDLPQMQLRMGVHSGPIKQVNDVNDRENFAGAGINMAQRVLDCGDAGHILLSKRSAEDLNSYRHWHPYLADLGECEVKHGVRMHLFNLCKDGVGNPAVPEKLRLQNGGGTKWRRLTSASASGMRRGALAIGAVLLLLAAGTTWWLLSRPPPASGIAVLPLGSRSGGEANALFVEGVHDEIHTNLSKLHGLKVISRSSLMAFKPGATRDVGEIARGLGVSHVLQGTVQRDGDRVRVHAWLTDARTDTEVWSESYNKVIGDLFTLQTEIAQAIVAQLRIRLSPAEKAAVEERPTSDFEAYDYYLHGKRFIAGAVYSATPKEDLLQATDMLNKAVSRDPNFAGAFFQLAHAHDQLYLRFEPTAERLELARSAVEAVRRLRPGSGEAHLALAKHLYWTHKDYDRARVELAIAQQLLPNDPTPPLLGAYIDRRQGRWDESTANFNRAIELDPLNPFTLQQLSLTYFHLRRYPEMAATLDRAISLAPADVVPRLQRAAVDMNWRADTKPLREAISAALQRNPGSASAVADHWNDLALHERDAAAATRAAGQMSVDGCHVGSVPFPRSWCEGLAARLRGDEDAARHAFSAARDEVAQVVRNLPEYAGALSALGMAHAALGEKDQAIRAGLRSIELQPISKDAVNGPLLVGHLAVIYGWTGEKTLAVEQLRVVTSVPSVWSYGHLILHPYWDPVREEPGFREILQRLAPR
jgi:TolB-like protein/Tfp pilus assembly protein PilF